MAWGWPGLARVAQCVKCVVGCVRFSALGRPGIACLEFRYGRVRVMREQSICSCILSSKTLVAVVRTSCRCAAPIVVLALPLSRHACKSCGCEGRRRPVVLHTYLGLLRIFSLRLPRSGFLNGIYSTESRETVWPTAARSSRLTTVANAFVRTGAKRQRQRNARNMWPYCLFCERAATKSA